MHPQSPSPYLDSLIESYLSGRRLVRPKPSSSRHAELSRRKVGSVKGRRDGADFCLILRVNITSGERLHESRYQSTELLSFRYVSVVGPQTGIMACDELNERSCTRAELSLYLFLAPPSSFIGYP
jgi:hypothetical protein